MPEVTIDGVKYVPVAELPPPTLAGGKLEAMDPNHRADLAYILDTLCEVRPVLKNEPLRERVTAAINGMTYIIDRTRRAARGVQGKDGDHA